MSAVPTQERPTQERSPREGGRRKDAGADAVAWEPVAFDSDAAIRVGMSAREQLETRWGLILVVYMRLLAALWILQGLREWSMFVLPRDEVFTRLSTGQATAVMYFSVINLLAAVGLWLATPWGGVLWLFAALSQIFVALTVSHVFTTAWVAIDLVLILVYFALTWQASRLAHEP